MGVDIYNAVKMLFVEKKIPLENLMSVTTNRAASMMGRHAGFIALCRGDTDFPICLHYRCITHQQALCAKVTSYKVLSEELSAENGDLLLHTEIRCLSRGRVLHVFCHF